MSNFFEIGAFTLIAEKQKGKEIIRKTLPMPKTSVPQEFEMAVKNLLV